MNDLAQTEEKQGDFEKASPCGLLLINKQAGISSFHLVALLRKILGVKKIGHAGTLDPFATGVMIMLVGRDYTKLSDQFLKSDKEYIADLHLGIETDTYDSVGTIVEKSTLVPTLEEIEKAVTAFQGEILQTPPMYSAKKVKGKKLYELARKGEVIERLPCKVTLKTEILSYIYPILKLKINCSKGTYIRSIAYDLGRKLGCFAHLNNLVRTASGKFLIQNCLDSTLLDPKTMKKEELEKYLLKEIA